jgi:hypothetical protein
MNTTPRTKLPVVEAAKKLGVTRSYVTRLLRGKKIKGRKITEVVWEVDCASLEKYMRSHQCN